MVENFVFEATQTIAVRVFDSKDGVSDGEEGRTLLGEGTFQLAMLMRSFDQKIDVPLKTERVK